MKQEQHAAEGTECNAAGSLPPSPQRRETVDPGDVAGSLPPSPQRRETADPVGGPRHRLTGKTIDFEARFALSKTPQHKHELHPMLLRCPVTEELDPEFVLGVRRRIQNFLELDIERGGSANASWPVILANSYPENELLSGPSGLADKLLHLVVRTWCARASPNFLDVAVQAVEFFAGHGLLTQAHVKMGFRCSRFDVLYDASHDVLETHGLRLWIDELVFTSPRSLQWYGTVCSSWVTLCQSKSKRVPSNGYLGDTSRPFVQKGNAQMVATSLLVFLSWMMNNEPILEQPATSSMPKAEPLATVFKYVGAIRTTTWLGAFGAKTWKPLQVWHCDGVFANLRRKRPPISPEAHEALVHKRGRKFSGNHRALKASQAYPAEFGVAVAECTFALAASQGHASA